MISIPNAQMRVDCDDSIAETAVLSMFWDNTCTGVGSRQFCEVAGNWA